MPQKYPNENPDPVGARPPVPPAPPAPEQVDGGPAFPVNEEALMRNLPGMSLRDYFAAKAMRAFLSGHVAHYGHENYWKPSDMASEAYGIADAMLAARKGGA